MAPRAPLHSERLQTVRVRVISQDFKQTNQSFMTSFDLNFRFEGRKKDPIRRSIIATINFSLDVFSTYGVFLHPSRFVLFTK